jgi:hypothetical protein
MPFVANWHTFCCPETCIKVIIKLAIKRQMTRSKRWA